MWVQICRLAVSQAPALSRLLISLGLSLPHVGSGMANAFSSVDEMG